MVNTQTFIRTKDKVGLSIAQTTALQQCCHCLCPKYWPTVTVMSMCNFTISSWLPIFRPYLCVSPVKYLRSHQNHYKSDYHINIFALHLLMHLALTYTYCEEKKAWSKRSIENVFAILHLSAYQIGVSVCLSNWVLDLFAGHCFVSSSRLSQIEQTLHQLLTDSLPHCLYVLDGDLCFVFPTLRFEL